MYRISQNKRKYSANPIVKVEIDKEGKETEKIVLVPMSMSKKDGDEFAEKIVELLNKNQ